MKHSSRKPRSVFLHGMLQRSGVATRPGPSGEYRLTIDRDCGLSLSWERARFGGHQFHPGAKGSFQVGTTTVSE